MIHIYPFSKYYIVTYFQYLFETVSLEENIHLLTCLMLPHIIRLSLSPFNTSLVCNILAKPALLTTKILALDFPISQPLFSTVKSKITIDDCLSKGSLESKNLWNESLSPYKGDLLERLTGCSPTNPTMAGCEQEPQESSSCSVHKAGCLRWPSVSARVPKK